jgi:hypothetical protein
MARSYSELRDKDDISALALAPYGLGRPTMSRAGWSPVGGGNSGNVEMAVSVISTSLLKMISNRSAGNAKRPGKAPFSDFQGHFHGHVGKRGRWK